MKISSSSPGIHNTITLWVCLLFVMWKGKDMSLMKTLLSVIGRQLYFTWFLMIVATWFNVCRKTFLNIFPIGRKAIETIVRKKKMGKTHYTDERSKATPLKFTAGDRQLVWGYIHSIPRGSSHYSRTKTDKEFLSPDLSINRLFRVFKEKYPSSCITFRYYYTVFKKDFPILSFRTPSLDTCRPKILWYSAVPNYITQCTK